MCELPIEGEYTYDIVNVVDMSNTIKSCRNDDANIIYYLLSDDERYGDVSWWLKDPVGKRYHMSPRFIYNYGIT